MLNNSSSDQYDGSINKDVAAVSKLVKAHILKTKGSSALKDSVKVNKMVNVPVNLTKIAAESIARVPLMNKPLFNRCNKDSNKHQEHKKVESKSKPLVLPSLANIQHLIECSPSHIS